MHDFLGLGVMIEEFVGDDLSVIGFNTGFSDGWSFEVFSEVIDVLFHVV